jgi:hypothetical protein
MESHTGNDAYREFLRRVREFSPESG